MSDAVQAPTWAGRFGRWLARALVRFYYPRIEIEGGDRLPATGPLVLAANHPNSLIDPVMLGIAARRPVRLMAKAPLFETPIFGGWLRALGMIPAYRAEDDPRAVRRNLESLTRAAQALAKESAAVGIFPEGRTHDEWHLARLKTGAARLALKAVGEGAAALPVVAVGLNYECKERFRSAVLVRVADPIDAAAVLSSHGGEERAAMRELTAEIESRLRASLIHLDDPAWSGLMDDVEWLLPREGRHAVAGVLALRSRKQVADAINYFHRADPARAHEAAARVSAHAEALRQVGLSAGARLLRERGFGLGWRLACDGTGAVLGAMVALFGFVAHFPPFGMSRLVARLFGREGKSTLAVWRLLLGGALLAVWYAVLGLAAALYFQPWVVGVLAVWVPACGLYARRWVRTQQTKGREWWAELKLLADSRRAAALRTEHDQIGTMLRALATEWAACPEARPSGAGPGGGGPEAGRRRTVRPPPWVAVCLVAAGVALAVAAAAWFWHDHPLEWRRTDAPPLHHWPATSLEAELDRDERVTAALVDGLDSLRRKHRAFQADLVRGQRSYYDPSDDDEIRRMVSTFLALRSVALRLAWTYERHGRLEPGSNRIRAARLHAAGLLISHDMAARFVQAFADDPVARRKLNEAEPRWDLPGGTFDSMQAALAHRGYRRLVEEALRPASATPPPREPAAVTVAIAEAVAGLGDPERGWLKHKLASRADALGDTAAAGLYRFRSGFSTLVGDARLRVPRQGRPLVSPAQIVELRSRLQPGDILIERRNWYLSNAFLPGYWPHSALHVGSVADLLDLAASLDRSALTWLQPAR